MDSITGDERMIDIEEVITKNKNLTDDVIDTFREGYGEDIAELFLIQRSLVQEVKRLREENNKLFATFADYIVQEEE